jgi:DNA repair photolyase
MRVQAGLTPEDWQRWGQFSTFKQNAAELLGKALRPDMIIYCSPLTDPYQPLEAEARIMPGIWRAIIEHPPRVMALQTRGPLLLRDLELLKAARARVSFSLTTDDDAVRRRFEPHCASIEERLKAMQILCQRGIDVFATLAPILPCDPERLVRLAASVTSHPLIGDPLHLRETKPRGATTRPGAFRILAQLDPEWPAPERQAEVVAKMKEAADRLGRSFAIGPAAFRLLTANL